MKSSGQLRQRTRILGAVALLLLSAAALTAQPDRRIVPRHDWAIELPELGRMTGLPEDGLFADQIYPVGDVDRDSLCDWIVTRSRRDTMVGGAYPLELLLYRGKRGGLPDVSERERIGPTEVGADVRFLAAGDWDGDGFIDLATAIHVFDDTTFGHVNGIRPQHLVVWWGQGKEGYSLSDTVRLENGYAAWFVVDGDSRDLNFDSVDDLLIVGANAFDTGETIDLAEVQVFIGRKNARWRTERNPYADWKWWDAPNATLLTVFKRTQWIDQDADGYLDFVWYIDGTGGSRHGSVSIIYGTPEHILDTANIHTISLDSAWGRHSLFSDITGDNVPELLVNAGRQEAIKAFVGFKGQRIEEQYGLGNEPGHPGEEVWWGKPWATIPLPGQLHDGWVPAGPSPIYDLGDVGLDGVCDVCVYSTPDYICYNGGQRFDSIYDSWISRSASGSGPIVVLGDIDGSGLNTIALGSDDLVAFYQPSTDVPVTGKYRYMPPGTGTPETGVSEENSNVITAKTLGLQAYPNPSSGIVRLTWGSTTGTATILITDQLGQTVTQFEVEATVGEAEWDASQTFGGVYFVSIEIDGVRESIEVRIQR